MQDAEMTGTVARNMSDDLKWQFRSFKIDATTGSILKRVELLKQLQDAMTEWNSRAGSQSDAWSLQRLKKQIETTDAGLLDCLSMMGKSWTIDFATSFLSMTATDAYAFAEHVTGQPQAAADTDRPDNASSQILVPFSNRAVEVWDAWKRRAPIKAIAQQFYKVLVAPRRLIPDTPWIRLLISEVGEDSQAALKNFLGVDTELPPLDTVHEVYMDELEIVYHPLEGVDWNSVCQLRSLGPQRVADALQTYPLFFAPSTGSELFEQRRFERLDAVFTNTTWENDVWILECEQALMDRSDLIHLLQPICEYELGWDKRWNHLQADLIQGFTPPVTPPRGSPRRLRANVALNLNPTQKQRFTHDWADATFLLEVSQDMAAPEFAKLVRQAVVWMLNNKSDLDAEVVKKIRSELQ